MYRIGILGSAGTGKSGLGIQLAEELNIPFLPARDITRDILKDTMFEYGQGLQVEKYLAREDYQTEILVQTKSRETLYDDFITDRTSIEIAAYSIAELNSENIDDIIQQCKEYAKNYTHLIFCKWGLKPLKPNQVRTLKPWYQFVIHSLINTLLDEWGLRFLLLDEANDKKRLEIVKEFIKKE